MIVKITVTADEAIELGIWEDLCRIKGINEYAVNEGMMDGSDEISLNGEEAAELGIHPIKN